MTISPKIPLWEIPRIWTGETVVCIGGGPSLTLEQIDMVYRVNSNVIAINDAYRMAPWADILYGCDAMWWRWHDGVPGFKGIKVALIGSKDGQGYEGKWADIMYDDIRPLAYNGIDGLEIKDPRYLRTGRNSGYQAINLAVQLGAKRIILIGYDMQSVTMTLSRNILKRIKKAIANQDEHIQSAIMASVHAVKIDHWFGAHPDNVTSHPFPQMLEAFESLRSVEQLYGVEIINCTPGSALDVFPKKELKEVIYA